MTLSRCAHCGAVAHYAKSVTDPHLCWSIQCSGCAISTLSYSQQEMAADAWNRVAKLAESRFNTTPEQDKAIAAIVQFRFDMNGRLDNIDWSECLWEIFDTVLTGTGAVEGIE